MGKNVKKRTELAAKFQRNSDLTCAYCTTQTFDKFTIDAQESVCYFQNNRRANVLEAHFPSTETNERGEQVNKIICKAAQVLHMIAALCLSCFALYTAFTGIKVDSVQRGVVLALVLILVFSKEISREDRKWPLKLLFFLIMVAGVVSSLYQVFNYKKLAVSLGAITSAELVIGILLIVALLTATKVRVGWPIVIISGLFMVYAYAGKYLTGMAAHRGYSITRIVAHLWNGTNGIFGTPLGTASGMVIMFILFGTFLEASGGAAFFMDLAIALTGKSVGGPAKAAVVSSALMGTISGNAASNVVTTGTFTIPLMKKTGYQSHVAGAVEAVASTGGQIMPPVMGAAAFIMAEIMGVSYGSIALAAIIPALLYYLSVFLMVHLEARKYDLGRMDDKEIPQLKETWKKNWHTLVPVVVLIGALVSGFSTIRSALYGVIAAFVCSWFREHTRITPKKLYQVLVDGADGVVTVVIACACAGIIIGCVSLTGLGLKLSSLIIAASGGHMIIALILTFIALFILGMGMPTAAAYIMVATLVAPGLVDMGLTKMAAHMFCLYGAVLSAITPPVALAAYAASGIAKANPMRIGFTACKFGLVAFIVPFMFAYEPALLGDGTVPTVALALVTASLGTIVLATGLQGFFLGRMAWIQRGLAVIGALTLMYPGLVTDLIGLGCAILALAPQLFRKKPEATTESAAGTPEKRTK